MKRIVLLCVFAAMPIYQYCKPLKMQRLNSRQGNYAGMTKLTKANFTDLVTSPENDPHYKRKMDKLFQLADSITITGNSQIKGLDLHKHALLKKLDLANAFMLHVTWGNNSDLLKTIEPHISAAPIKAMQILCDNIIACYAEAKSPLIRFAVDIDKEDTQIQKHLETLTAFSQKNIAGEEKMELQKTIETLLTLQKNVTVLINLINGLLAYEN